MCVGGGEGLVGGYILRLFLGQGWGFFSDAWSWNGGWRGEEGVSFLDCWGGGGGIIFRLLGGGGHHF